MKIFRPKPEESSGFSLKITFLAILILLIVFSFFLQMSLGICPVP
jgi:hypothetical protein